MLMSIGNWHRDTGTAQAIRNAAFFFLSKLSEIYWLIAFLVEASRQIDDDHKMYFWKRMEDNYKLIASWFRHILFYI